MRKIVAFLVLVFGIVPAIWSLDIDGGYLYMTPYSGAFNFNLKDGVEDFNAPRIISDSYSTIFDDAQIIALGGGIEYPSRIFSDDSINMPTGDGRFGHRAVSNLYKGIRYTIECPQYDAENGCFYFIKQSDPDFRFPFMIQIGGRYNSETSANQDNHKLSVGVIGKGNYDSYKQVDPSLDLIPDSSGYISFVVPNKNDAIPCISTGYNVDYSTYVDKERLLFMNFAVFFPGEIDQENGVFRLDNGSIYPIAAGDDYSAHIRIMATVVETGESISVDIPFSAFYHPDGAAGEKSDTSASLFVEPLAAAGNIDLDGAERQFDVATIDFAYNMNDKDSLNNDFGNRAYLFLSTSENPFNSSSQGFVFVKDDVKYGDILTDENSIGYTVIAANTGEKPSEDTSSVVIAEIRYDGTDSIDTVNDNADKQMRTYHHYRKTHGASQHWHTYNGIVSIILDDNSLMNEGYYRSYIYVHVVTNEEADPHD